LPLRKYIYSVTEHQRHKETDATVHIFTNMNKNAYIFDVMNVFVAPGITHHFVKTELILSKEKRRWHILREKIISYHHTQMKLWGINYANNCIFLETYMANPACLAQLLKFL